MLITRGMGSGYGTSPDPSGVIAYIQEPDISSIEYGTAGLSSQAVLPYQGACVVNLVPSLSPFSLPEGLSASEVDMRPSLKGTESD